MISGSLPVRTPSLLNPSLPLSHPPFSVLPGVERQAIDIAMGKVPSPSSPPAEARSSEDSAINGGVGGPTGYVSFPPSPPTGCDKGEGETGGVLPPAPAGDGGGGRDHSRDHGHVHNGGKGSHAHGCGAGESSARLGQTRY